MEKSTKKGMCHQRYYGWSKHHGHRLHTTTRYTTLKMLTSFAPRNNHLKLKYVYRHLQINIVCYCNVDTTKLWIFGMRKIRNSYLKNNNSIEKLIFPYVLHKTRHHYTRASFRNSWRVMHYNETILTSIGCLFKWLHQCKSNFIDL